jgi:hypothetical protein
MKNVTEDHQPPTDEELALWIKVGNEAQLDYIQNGFKYRSRDDPWVLQAQLQYEVAAEMDPSTARYYESVVAYRGVAKTLELSDNPVTPDK